MHKLEHKEMAVCVLLETDEFEPEWKGLKWADLVTLASVEDAKGHEDDLMLPGIAACDEPRNQFFKEPHWVFDLAGKRRPVVFIKATQHNQLVQIVLADLIKWLKTIVDHLELHVVPL